MKDTLKATLQLALEKDIKAYELEGVIYVINELYTHYCWLEQAEKHNGPEPYGDSKFAPEDFLVVQKVEIGTPNLIELCGWLEPLKAAILFVAASLPAGALLLKSASEAYKNWLEARRSIARDGHEQSMQEQALLKAKLENEKLVEELAQIKLAGRNIESPAEKAQRLHPAGKVSLTALEYKRTEQSRIDDRIKNWRVFEHIVIQMNLSRTHDCNEPSPATRTM